MSANYLSEGRIEEIPVYRIFAEIITRQMSGVLTVHSKQDTVDVCFDKGACIFAESHYPRDGIRLGQLLVLRGYCNQTQLDDLLETQKTRMVKLGRLARDAEWLTDTELMRVLEDQILLIVFPLLTWTKGLFYFNSSETVSYDRMLLRPIDLKPVCRSGQKILKNWSWMTERLPDDSIIPSRIPGIETVPEGVKIAHSSSDTDPKVLTRLQEKVYEVIDGRRNIREVCDTVHMFEWFTRVSILDLQDADIISLESPKTRKRDRGKTDSDSTLSVFKEYVRPHLNLAAKLAAGIVFFLVIGFFISQFSFKNILKPDEPTALRFSPKTRNITVNRGDEIRLALMVFHLFKDRYPETLQDLIEGRIIESSMITDGWGIDFVYEQMNGNYELKSSGPDRQFDTADDIVFLGAMNDHVFGSFFPRYPVFSTESVQ